MTARRVAVVAGLVGGVAWIAKLLVMAAQGGPDPESVIETIAFLTGLVGVLVATAAAAVHLTRDRARPVRAGSAVGAVVALVISSLLLQTALTSVPGDSWIQAEAVFGVVGLAVLIGTIFLARRSQAPRERRTPRPQQR